MGDHLAGAIAPVGALLCAVLIGCVSIPIALSYPSPTVKSQSRIAMEAPAPSFAAIKSEPEVTVHVVVASLGPTPVLHVGPFAAIPAKPERVMGPVDDYLCEVYARTPSKKDGSGDFTWKDPAAAKRVKMDLCGYVIAGMNKDFREQLYHAGKAMDKAGIRWSMLSAFRDDYRQKIASGLKARTGNSMHGGSRVTGGHGDGRAVDIAAADGAVGKVLKFIDATGAKFGLYRPYKGFDPQHVQPTSAWQKLAAVLRVQRAGSDANKLVASQEKSKTKIASIVKKTKIAKRHKVKKTRYAKRYKKRHRYASRA